MPSIVIQINEEEAQRFLDVVAEVRGYNAEEHKVSKAEFISNSLALDLAQTVLQHEINAAVKEVTDKQNEQTIDISVKTEGFNE